MPRHPQARAHWGPSKLTKRKARTVGILLSSTSSRRAFSWLLQYSSYTQNLSFCKATTELWETAVAGTQTLGAVLVAGPAWSGGLAQSLSDTRQEGLQGRWLQLPAGLAASTPVPIVHPTAGVAFEEAAQPRVKCTDSSQQPEIESRLCISGCEPGHKVPDLSGPQFPHQWSC